MPQLSKTAITSHVWTAEEPKHWITAQFTDSQSPPKRHPASRCCSTLWNSSVFALSANKITLKQPVSSDQLPLQSLAAKARFSAKLPFASLITSSTQ